MAKLLIDVILYFKQIQYKVVKFCFQTCIELKNTNKTLLDFIDWTHSSYFAALKRILLINKKLIEQRIWFWHEIIKDVE